MSYWSKTKLRVSDWLSTERVRENGWRCAADANSISSALTIMSDPCVTSSIPEDITNHEFDANALRLHDGRVTSRAKAACSN